MNSSVFTLSQKRAEYAYKEVVEFLQDKNESFKKELASFVAGVPVMILQNGLGHTLCFLLAKGEEKHKFTYKAIINWLKNGIEWLDEKNLSDISKNLNVEEDKAVIKFLAGIPSIEYITIQEEVLRFVEWLKVMTKMFAKGEDR